MNVAMVGAGRRARNIYLPVLLALPNAHISSICSRNPHTTKEFASHYKIASSTLDKVLADPNVDCIIACVDWAENAKVYQQLATSNKPCLLETPLGHDKESIDACYNALKKRQVYIDIAEQYHLKPMESLKRQLLASGLLGELVEVYSNGAAHEYHGASLIRSYIGFDQKLTKVVAMQRDAPYFAHMTHKGIYFAGERITNSILQFSSGVHATFHWSWLNYKSPIRARRSAGFYATKGAAWGDECMVLKDEDSPAQAINFERRTVMVNSQNVLAEIVARLDNQIVGRWSNPFQEYNLNEDQIIAAFFVHNLLQACGDKNIKPLYPPHQAYEDHMIVNAMYAALNKS